MRSRRALLPTVKEAPSHIEQHHDDRERAGVRFEDADRAGIPLRGTVADPRASAQLAFNEQGQK